jgi:glycosyltransferase involved in cell wall biosynthesis
VSGATARPHPPALVSVVIPVLDGEHYIGQQLDALADQAYPGDWEVVIVDNGCTDKTLTVVRAFAARFKELRVADARDSRGLNHARNVGAREARGELLAYCDADDIVVPGWLEALVDAAREADIVAGPLEVESLNSRLVRTWHPSARVDGLPDGGHGFLPYAPGGNCAIWADVARTVGWDERFTLGGADYEFCWRAQLSGYTLGFAPGAVLRRRLHATLWGLARQHYRYGLSRALLLREFRPHGLALRPRSELMADLRWLAARAPATLRDPELRGRWLRVAALHLGGLVGALRLRVRAA